MSNSQAIKYFVTGGAGFIGSHLTDRLAEQGQVTVYDNLSSGKIEFIEHHLDNRNFSFIQADLFDIDTLRAAMEGQDIVFHLAANPDIRAGIQKTDLDLKQGTLATYNVLEAMRLDGIKKIIFASSSVVYGETPVKPISEDYGPLQPISLYGASKLAGEGLITAFCHLFGFQAWIFRFANVAGGRATHGIILDLINKIRQDPTEVEVLGTGTQSKPYIHVDDCVDGILWGFEHASEKVNVLNLGTASFTRVSTIAETLIKELGLANIRIKYTGDERGWPGDVPQVRFDTSRMNRLGWKARYSSDKAVLKAIKSVLENTV
ncbi:MAG: NAD-dependent epimerase/dehydratase family protein [Dehalococcoidales bacterium]